MGAASLGCLPGVVAVLLRREHQMQPQRFVSGLCWLPVLYSGMATPPRANQEYPRITPGNSSCQGNRTYGELLHQSEAAEKSYPGVTSSLTSSQKMFLAAKDRQDLRLRNSC